LDVIYRQKAIEVQAVILRLEAGEAVPQAEVDHALDSTLASELGGY
jgi:hypothetical protein